MNPVAIAVPVEFNNPAADIRDEIAAASGVPELPEKIWFQKTAAAVIDAGRCVGCGGCIAACPSRSIDIGEDGRPTLVRMCTGCSACWDYCPLAGLRTERLATDIAEVKPEGAVLGGEFDLQLGHLIAASSARAVTPVPGMQDGGVVTALLSELLDAGHIDGAIVNHRIDALHGEPVLVTASEELQACAGSVYEQSHALTALNTALPPGVNRLAFVGTPCQVSVLRALQRFPWRYRNTAADAVVLTVALFCTRSFDAELLGQALSAAGADGKQMAKIDVCDGQIIAWSDDGEELVRRPVREMQPAALKGCSECADFAGLAADLAVGSIGSEPGWTTVLTRTEAGRAALERGSPALQIGPAPDLGRVAQTAARDGSRAVRALERDFDPEGELWIGYPEHIAAYAGTERAAAAPPPYRSQHYQVSC